MTKNNLKWPKFTHISFSGEKQLPVIAGGSQVCFVDRSIFDIWHMDLKYTYWCGIVSHTQMCVSARAPSGITGIVLSSILMCRLQFVCTRQDVKGKKTDSGREWCSGATIRARAAASGVWSKEWPRVVGRVDLGLDESQLARGPLSFL